ncbi:MAG: hypothetical protein CMJ58_19875 [Planctomycetaceae bacterium]|nr:hypothetical protein [Planctomycetaceae bacterium]
MNKSRQNEFELTRILMAAVDGQATDAELQRANAMVTDDPALARVVVDVLTQESWLTWHSTKARQDGELRGDLLQQIVAAAQSTAAAGARETTVSAGAPARRSDARSASGWLLAALAASVVVAAGWGYHIGRSQRDAPVANSGASPALQDEEAPAYDARIVHRTACLWSSSGDVLFDDNYALRVGEALTLLEGLAQLQIDWSAGQATLEIEGPAGLVLTADHGASLSHGKLTADVAGAASPFRLTTPNGEVEVAEGTKLGLAIAGGAVEVHVFEGRALAKIPWADDQSDSKQVTVGTGQSLTISAASDGRVHWQRGTASRDSFAWQRSMGADSLRIPPQYVQAVLEAKPLLYWRFEEANPDHVTNAAGDRFHGRVVGTAEFVKHGDNQVVELGSTPTERAYTTFLTTDEPVADVLDEGYSIEAWVKPSHYHWATLVGMVCPPPAPEQRRPHAFLLELGGPRAAATSIEHPGRIRFLHRNPPSDDVSLGTSIFSEQAYDLRQWQHIVAVKRGAAMALYVNGKLTAAGDDTTPLPAGWRLIVGQLDEGQDYRRFIGQLDELAVYPRSLTEQEIRSHFELSRRSQRALPPPATDRAVRLQIKPPAVDWSELVQGLARGA